MKKWRFDGRFEARSCAHCHGLFTPHSGSHKLCSETCRAAWRRTHWHTTDWHYARITGRWERYFARRVVAHGRAGQISVADCLELLERQGGRCALTGLELTCRLEKGVRVWTNASLDRIQPGGSYAKANVQLVCAAVNLFRRDFTIGEFVWWCQKVVEHHGTGLQTRI